MTRILFNCDDFGGTREINAAVLKAHREGVLGSASLMVTGNAFAEAVEIARACPSLKVGLHLALNDAQPVLSKEQIPILVGAEGDFHQHPATVGIRLAVDSSARIQAGAEIAAQFERFAATGLARAHVDSHHHLHMHPFVFRECVRQAAQLGFERIRVVREFGDPLPPRRDSNGFAGKLARHLTFLALAAVSRRFFIQPPLRALNGILGLWETGHMNEDYLLGAISQLPSGDWEIYMHLGSDSVSEELSAITSPRLKSLLEQRGIERL